MKIPEFNSRVSKSSHVNYVNPIHIKRNGKCGHPWKDIDPTFLQMAFDPSRHIKLRQLARQLKIHPQTLKARLQQNGIDYQFSTISDNELDIMGFFYLKYSYRTPLA